MPHVLQRNESSVTMSPRAASIGRFVGKGFAVLTGLAILLVIFT